MPEGCVIRISLRDGARLTQDDRLRLPWGLGKVLKEAPSWWVR